MSGGAYGIKLTDYRMGRDPQGDLWQSDANGENSFRPSPMMTANDRALQNGTSGYSGLSTPKVSYGGLQINPVAQAAGSQALRLANVNEEDLANDAGQNAGQRFELQRMGQLRDMSRMGINPNSGRYAGADQGMRLIRAAAEAGARNQARITARQASFQNNMAILGNSKNFYLPDGSGGVTNTGGGFAGGYQPGSLQRMDGQQAGQLQPQQPNTNTKLPY